MTACNVSLPNAINEGEIHNTRNDEHSNESKEEEVNEISVNTPIEDETFAVMTITTEQAIAIDMGENKQIEQVEVITRKVEDYNRFQALYSEYLNNQSEGINRDEHMLISRQIKTYDKGENNRYLEIASLQSEGYYFTELIAEDIHHFIFFQTGNILSYYAKANNEALLWLVNNNDNKVSKDIEVYADGDFIGRTNEKGLFVIEEEDQNKLLSLKDGKKQYIVKSKEVNNSNYQNTLKSRERVSSNRDVFIHMDRKYYEETDNINVFAYHSDIPKKSDVKIKIKHALSNNLITHKDVRQLNDHTFTENIEVQNLDPGYYILEIEVDGELKAFDEFQVVRVVKKLPLFKSNIKESIVFLGDDINFEMTYQGSQQNDVKEKPLEIYHGNAYDMALESFSSAYTNSNGGFNGKVKTTYTTTDWRPMVYCVEARMDNSEVDLNYTPAYVRLLPRDVMIQGEIKEENDTIKLSIETHEIDLSRYLGDFGYKYNNIKGKSVSKDLIVEIFEITYDNEEENHSIQRIQEKIKTIKVKTIKGKGELEIVGEKNKSYQFVVSTNDSKSRLTQSTFEYKMSLDPLVRNNRSYDMNGYVFGIGDNIIKRTFKAGEILTRHIYYDGKRVDSEVDQTLFLRTRNGIVNYLVTDKAEIDWQVRAEDAPNINLEAVHFDGEKILKRNSIPNSTVEYDLETLELDLSVELEKLGDEISLKLSLKDSDGQFVDGDINISVKPCEEHSLEPANLTFLNGLYSSGIIFEDTTSFGDIPMKINDSSQKYYRKNLTVEGLFKGIYSNTISLQGQANESFKLPNSTAMYEITLIGFDKMGQYCYKKIYTSYD